MNIAIALLHLVLLAALAYALYRRETALRVFFFPALVVKLLAGVSLGLLYTWYYSGGDTFVYFQDARQFAALALSDPLRYVGIMWSGQGLPGDVVFGMDEPRALFLVKVASVFHLFTQGNYWLIAIWFSTLSFLGAWFLAKQIASVLPSLTLPAAVAFLFFPSLVFWSSGLIKESLTMAALYFVVGVFLRYWFGRSVRVAELILSAVALWVTWKLKYYFPAVLIPVVLACLATRYVNDRFLHVRHFTVRLAIWIVLLITPAMLMTLLHPNFAPSRFLHVIVNNNHAFLALSEPGDFIRFGTIEPSFICILSHAPLAIFSGLFRPGVWEAHTLLQGLVAAENLLILTLTVLAILDWKSVKNSPNRLLIIAALVYILVLCTFITISTPNFGTLSRYRIGYLPFYLFLVLCNKMTLRAIQRLQSNLVR